MKLYKKDITLDLLKKHNQTFFSKDTVSFHKDNRYSIIEDLAGNRTLLKVNNDLTGVAYYEVNKDNYQLTYTNY